VETQTQQLQQQPSPALGKGLNLLQQQQLWLRLCCPVQAEHQLQQQQLNTQQLPVLLAAEVDS